MTDCCAALCVLINAAVHVPIRVTFRVYAAVCDYTTHPCLQPQAMAIKKNEEANGGRHKVVKYGTIAYSKAVIAYLYLC
ncbi:hypothetical protein EJB05_44442 [Eragrostis curvula]|uniref:Uncharacterized protein n=2 Tax=Eragrostis curvula TaxID=38414 RepID=A0A5J9TJ27_9POAL|nr:hypothetical protein EJB05_44442 [Eragrostis curvula]